MVTYSESGVDIAAGNAFVEWLQKSNSSIGGFSGLYPLGDQYLAACTDGVGTKVRIAQEMGKHSGIGIDLVAMCVNDVVCCGAKPLFFLDYLAMGKLEQPVAQAIMGGILEGCEQSGCPLLGGETAEMPGCYATQEYDVAGFCVGIVDKNKLIEGKEILPGDFLIGFPSTGVHSNGFSLVRKVIEDRALDMGDVITGESTLGELLLEPTRIYVPEAMKAVEKGLVKGMAHITGGGLPGNICRVLPKGYGAILDPAEWSLPPVLEFLIEEGAIPIDEAAKVFNLGIGFVMVCSEEALPEMKRSFPDSIMIGIVVEEEGIHWRTE